MKRLLLILGTHAKPLAEIASLLAVGVGLGWWVHPGSGLLAVGAISLGLSIYAHERDVREQANNA